MAHGGLDKLIRSITAGIAQRIEFNYKRMEDRWHSQIEHLFYTAVSLELEHSCLCRAEFTNEELESGPDQNKDHLVGIFDFWIERQAFLLDWPVDFVIWLTSMPDKNLVVECDGHEFHERTPEQAKRDRERDRRLQRAGYHVFRFTGSEIWRDAHKCAQEAIDWLMEQDIARYNAHASED